MMPSITVLLLAAVSQAQITPSQQRPASLSPQVRPPLAHGPLSRASASHTRQNPYFDDFPRASSYSLFNSRSQRPDLRAFAGPDPATWTWKGEHAWPKKEKTVEDWLASERFGKGTIISKVKGFKCTESTVPLATIPSLQLMIAGVTEGDCASRGFTQPKGEEVTKSFVSLQGIQSPLTLRIFSKTQEEIEKEIEEAGKRGVAASELDARVSPNLTSLFAVMLLTFFTGSGVTYTIFRYRQSSLRSSEEPFLA